MYDQNLASLNNKNDMEKFFKFLCLTYKNEKKLSKEINAGKDLLETYQMFKDEFKVFRQYWLNVSYQINALDELDMVKMRQKLVETKQNEKQQHRVIHNKDYQIEAQQIPAYFEMHSNQVKQCESELRRKLGQMAYLRSLQKTYLLKEGEENEEICPICQCWFLILLLLIYIN
jgi:hypothetical protein